MRYSEFNKKVLDYYLSRSSSFFCNLAIDETQLSSIISLGKIKEFDILKLSWEPLLNKREGVPQYFGLLAIQCYAASLMHDDGFNASDNYQVRLREVLGIKQSLQGLFKGNLINISIQEKIWEDAKDYLKRQFNVSLKIPERVSYSGKYVQYPKYQSLLNLEDLKYFTAFFASELKVNETLIYSFFEEVLKVSLHNIKISPRAKVLLADPEKRERCVEQIFNFYNRWDGFVFDFDQKLIGKPFFNTSKTIYHKKLSLLFDGADPIFYLDIENNIVVNGSDIFNIDNYKYLYSDLIILNESDYYPNEYEESRFLYSNKVSYLIVNTKVNKPDYYFLKENAQEVIHVAHNIVAYKYIFSDIDYESPLFKYVEVTSPLRLIGGIRLNRSNQYLVGYGPSIVGDLLYKVVVNSAMHIYNPELSDVGDYVVRTEKYGDLKFSLVSIPPQDSIIVSKGKGWNINTYAIDEDTFIEGFLFKMNNKRSDVHPVRKWINKNMPKVRGVAGQFKYLNTTKTY